MAEDIRKGRKVRRNATRRKPRPPVQTPPNSLNKDSLSYVDKDGKTQDKIPY